MHSAINQTKDIVTTRDPSATNSLALSSSLTAWLVVLLLWICAGCFLFRMHRSHQHEPDAQRATVSGDDVTSEAP
jgi:hypothetical protein